MAKSAERLAREEEEYAVVAYLKQRASELSKSEVLRQTRVATTSAGRETLFFAQLAGALKEVFAGKFPAVKPAKKPAGKTSRILNLLISDTHYGSSLDPREVGHKYGAVEEARRTAAICKQVAEYKIQYRDETHLYVHILGDIIQGQLHDMRDGLPLAEQVASAIRVLVQALRYLSVQFPRGVTVFCTPGNHGRNTARHRDRATNQKWDSIETMIYLALKEVAVFLPNVRVKLDYKPAYDFDAFGTLGFATHGDTVLAPGYPGRNIDVGGMTKQINQINNARVHKKLQPYKLFMVGHVHVGSTVRLPGGVTMITNGCLLPPDAYATSIGIYDTNCGQTMWESVPGHMVGDLRFIEVGPDNDTDASLDSIIEPFTGL